MIAAPQRVRIQTGTGPVPDDGLRCHGTLRQECSEVAELLVASKPVCSDHATPSLSEALRRAYANGMAERGRS